MEFKDDKQKKVISEINEYTSIQYFFTSNQYELPLDKLSLSFNHQFSLKRLSDFSTGRYCAKQAMEQIGIYDVIIPIGKDREPIWPDGIVGSISHCDSLTGAIVAKSSDHISLGLDIEEIGKVTTDLYDLVFTENEKSYLSNFAGRKLEEQSTLIFSIKEAFYKYQHPLTKTFLDFLDVELSLPSMDNVLILSKQISKESEIRNNRIKYFFDNDCVISIITKN